MSRKHSIISRHKLKFGGTRTKKIAKKKIKKKKKKTKNKREGGGGNSEKKNINYVDALPSTYGEGALPIFNKYINRGVKG
jgi:hypothetical protein